MFIKTYNAVVISDDEREINHLKTLFSTNDLNGSNVNFLSSGQAFSYLEENQPEIVFLDFQLDMFLIVRFLKAIINAADYAPELIFITRQHPNDIDFVDQSGFIHFCKPAEKHLLLEIAKQLNEHSREPDVKIQNRRRILSLLESVNYSGN